MLCDRSHFKATVQRQPQVRTLLEWRRLASNRNVRRMAASIPNTAPVVHFTLCEVSADRCLHCTAASTKCRVQAPTSFNGKLPTKFCSSSSTEIYKINTSKKHSPTRIIQLHRTTRLIDYEELKNYKLLLHKCASKHP